ncbi:hypothetical protein IV203_025951 [Nitzschia inconspicua]|uniref:Uncharacterized protein n=1 Tax=Nitzschia inconspicua TaxID=303405 RepID=A0A9K3LH35_9STRA|nr:hypothetical protein IV203_025951 [Nitzschia inconspicua]
MIRTSASATVLSRALVKKSSRISSMMPSSSSRSSAISVSHCLSSRSYYMGGDAHLYYASKEYVFDRPPNMTGEGGDSVATTAAAATITQHPLNFSTSASSTAGASAATATSGVTATLGSAWLAYETAEFTPWEEVLLDATAWMIAIVLCWDPMRHEREKELEDDDDDDESRRRREHLTRRKQQRRQLAQQSHEDEEEPGKQQQHEDDHDKDDNRN